MSELELSAEKRQKGHKKMRRRRIIRIVISIGVVILILISVFIGIKVHQFLYERTHDIPNPTWGTFNGGYTYTPQQGPPGPGLLNNLLASLCHLDML